MSYHSYNYIYFHFAPTVGFFCCIEIYTHIRKCRKYNGMCIIQHSNFIYKVKRGSSSHLYVPLYEYSTEPGHFVILFQINFQIECLLQYSITILITKLCHHKKLKRISLQACVKACTPTNYLIIKPLMATYGNNEQTISYFFKQSSINTI